MLNSYYYKNLHEKTINQISQMGLKKFQSHLYDIMLDPKNKTISSYKKPYEPLDIEIIYRAIDKKINRLNSNLYSYADNISLYLEMAMYSVESANRSIAEKILAYAKESSKNKSLFFKEIFYDCMVCLYRINLQTETIAEIDIFNSIDSIELKYEINRTMLGDFYDQL